MFGIHPHAGGHVNNNAPSNRPQELRYGDCAVRFVKVDATDPVKVKKALAAIAKLYAKRGKGSPLQTIKNVRFTELEIVFAWCWRGTELPDDDAGREDLFTACCHLWHLGRKVGREIAIRSWAALWAPWCGPEELTDLIKQVAASPQTWKADPLAHRLGFYMTNQLRAALRLTTIGDIDVGKAGREKRRVKHKKQNSTAWRNGAVPRSVYEGQSLSRTKPWEAEGIGRRTWERRRKKVAAAQAGADDASAYTPKNRDILLYSDLRHDVDSRAHQAPERLVPIIDVIEVYDDGVGLMPPPDPRASPQHMQEFAHDDGRRVGI
jgi:hypothetical protein